MSKTTSRSSGGSGSEKNSSTHRHSECSASEAPVSLHPTPERKKKKKRRRSRNKSSSEADTGNAGVQHEVETSNQESEPVEGQEQRKGCKDCLMENCTGAVTLYRCFANNFPIIVIKTSQ